MSIPASSVTLPRAGQLRRAILVLVAVVVIVVTLASHWGEAETVAQTLSRGRWEWIVAAAGLQIAYFVLYAALYQSALRVTGVSLRISELLPIWFAATFLNIVTPAAGATLIIAEAGRRSEGGQGAARAAAGLIVVKIADLASFFPFLLLGFVYLFRRHDLKAYELIAAAAAVVLIGVWCGVLGVGVWRTALLLRLFRGVQKVTNRVAARFRPAQQTPLLPVDWAERQTNEYAAAARACLTAPRSRVVAPFLFGIAAHTADVASLGLLFRAFGQPITPGALVAGFAAGLLFWIVSVTPEGVGAVEGMMTLTFVSLGVAAPRAAAITIAFRGLTLYLPVLVGLLFVHRFWRGFGPQNEREPQSETSEADAFPAVFAVQKGAPDAP